MRPRETRSRLRKTRSRPRKTRSSVQRACGGRRACGVQKNLDLIHSLAVVWIR
uniref:Uncharacterized protein n=1 Tax=Fagus sylvatica TaxID=28930 RepID=A0A2N9ISD9_FAGSY